MFAERNVPSSKAAPIAALTNRRSTGLTTTSAFLAREAGRASSGSEAEAPAVNCVVLHDQPIQRAWDFTDIPLVAPNRVDGLMGLQPKLAIAGNDHPLEQEADRAADEVMSTSTRGISAISAVSSGVPPQPISEGPAACGCDRPSVNSGVEKESCASCGGEVVHRRAASTPSDHAGQNAEAKINAVSGGQPMSTVERALFEPRFEADFSQVRIHRGRTADAAARSVGALAYTRGHDIVLREGAYQPETYTGRWLLAHELAHVVQQGAAEPVPKSQTTEPDSKRSQLLSRTAAPAVQLFPGDGMTPPGDCGLLKYAGLRGSVETAKAVVGMLGACAIGDNCMTLALKIAAISAEIAARVALDTSCFKGGDTGHRQQVQDKVNMVNRCYRFFSNMKCPPALIAAMEIVVARAREVIAAAAVVLAVALVVALVLAIIALAEAIAAIAAAAAEGAAVAVAAAAVIALLMRLRTDLGSSESEA